MDLVNHVGRAELVMHQINRFVASTSDATLLFDEDHRCARQRRSLGMTAAPDIQVSVGT
jgi:hypothetical protein